MNLSIVGSRSLNIDLKKFIIERPNLIITGDAKGIDKCARVFAIKNNIDLKVFKLDYRRYGKVAPLVRNKSIVKLCDKLIAFWDGKSSGTMSAVNIAIKQNKGVKIFIVKDELISLFFESNNQMMFTLK